MSGLNSYKIIVFIFIIIGMMVCGLLCFLMTRTFSTELKHHEIEELIGTTLPSSANELNYHKEQPWLGDPLNVSNWYWHETYIRFKVSEKEYLELMEQMDMELYNTNKTIFTVYWPGGWKQNIRRDIEWWNPRLDTPRYAAIKTFDGEGGEQIFAIYENGYVFIKIVAS